MTANVTSAIRREKQLKQLKRVRKIRLIEKMNPEWKDLAGMQVLEELRPLNSSLREESG